MHRSAPWGVFGFLVAVLVPSAVVASPRDAEERIERLTRDVVRETAKALEHAERSLDRIERHHGPSHARNRDAELRALADKLARDLQDVEKEIDREIGKISRKTGVPEVDLQNALAARVRVLAGPAIEARLAALLARLRDLLPTASDRTRAALDRAIERLLVSSRRFDLTAPVIADRTPAPGAILATATPTISASFSDNLSGVDPATARIVLDGVDRTAEATVSAAGLTLTPFQALPDLVHSVQVEVSDFGGNPASASWQFTTDVTRTVIASLDPADGAFLNDPRPLVRGTYSDNLSGIDTANVRLFLDGSDVSSQAQIDEDDASFTPAANLQEGPHTSILSVADRAGNETTREAAWTLDLTRPTLLVVEPADGSMVSTATPTMRIAYEDLLSGIELGSLVIMLDGLDITQRFTRTTAEATFIPSQADALSEGPHTLTVSVADSAGNVTQAVTMFTVGILPNLLLVDDDGGGTLEHFFAAALTARGVAFRTHEVATGGVPTAAFLSQFEQVVWTTGDTFFPALDGAEINVLRQYLDRGGSLLLSSEGFAADVLFSGDPGAQAFSRDFLHVASFAGSFFGAVNAMGESGDPIGDGLVLDLSNPVLFNFTDAAFPDGEAATVFRNQATSEPIAIRFPAADADTFRTVFLAFPFEAIDPNSAAPNTPGEVIGRAIDFLAPRFVVVRSFPEGGATGIATNARVHLKLSGKVNPNTLTSSTVFLAGPTGSIAAAITLDSTNNLITLSPGSRLPSGVAVTVTATTGLRDTRGRPLEGQFVASFTTGTAVDPVSPASPVGVTVDPDVVTGKSVTLTWDANADADILGYRIFRKLPSEIDFQEIGFAVHPVTRFIDRGARPGIVHTYAVTAVDIAANESAPSSPVQATPVDTTPPFFVVTSHFGFQFVNTPSIVLEGTIDDPDATITFNGVPGGVTDERFESAPINLSEGENAILIRVEDLFGNFFTQMFFIRVDTAPPFVQVTVPQAGTAVTGSSVKVIGSVLDENLVSFAIEEGDGTSPADYRTIATVFSTGEQNQILAIWDTFGLQEGIHTLRLRALDRADNQSVYTVNNVTVDNLQNFPVNLGPLTGTVTADNTPVVFGRAFSGTQVRIYVDGFLVATTTANVRGDFSVELPVLGDGAHTITTTMIIDGEESTQSTPVSIAIDTAAPDTTGFITYTNAPDGEPEDPAAVTEQGNKWALLGASTMDDVFGGATLDPKWTQIRAPFNGWGVANGEFFINMDPFEDLENSNNAPILAQAAPTGDFSATVTVRGHLSVPFQQGGLVVRENDDNYVIIAKAFIGTGQFVYAAYEQDGILNFLNVFDLPAVQEDVHLRVRRNGANMYFFDYSLDGVGFANLAAVTLPADMQIGLTAFSDSFAVTSVRFDNFTVTNGIPTTFPTEGLVVFNTLDMGTEVTFGMSSLVLVQGGDGAVSFQFATDQGGAIFNGTWLSPEDFRLQSDSTSQFFTLKARLEGDGTQASSIDDIALNFSLLAGDLSPPLTPSPLAATPRDEAVELTWPGNVELDLSGYRLRRGTASGVYDTEFFLTTNRFTDNTVENGSTYLYVVSAADVRANESAPSNEASATPRIDTDAPAISVEVEGIQNGFVSSNSPLIRVLRSDEDSGLDQNSLRILLNGEDITGLFARFNGFVFFRPENFSESLDDGSYLLEVEVDDNRDNRAEFTFEFIVDTRGPTITIDSPQFGQRVLTRKATFVVRIEDAGGGVDPGQMDAFLATLGVFSGGQDVSILFDIAGTPNSLVATAILDEEDFDQLALGFGTRRLTIESTDRAGNTGLVIRNFLLAEVPQYLLDALNERNIRGFPSLSTALSFNQLRSDIVALASAQYGDKKSLELDEDLNILWRQVNFSQFTIGRTTVNPPVNLLFVEDVAEAVAMISELDNYIVRATGRVFTLIDPGEILARGAGVDEDLPLVTEAALIQLERAERLGANIAQDFQISPSFVGGGDAVAAFTIGGADSLNRTFRVRFGANRILGSINGLNLVDQRGIPVNGVRLGLAYIHNNAGCFRRPGLNPCWQTFTQPQPVAISSVASLDGNFIPGEPFGGEDEFGNIAFFHPDAEGISLTELARELTPTAFPATFVVRRSIKQLRGYQDILQDEQGRFKAGISFVAQEAAVDFKVPNSYNLTQEDLFLAVVQSDVRLRDNGFIPPFQGGIFLVLDLQFDPVPSQVEFLLGNEVPVDVSADEAELTVSVQAFKSDENGDPTNDPVEDGTLVDFELVTDDPTATLAPIDLTGETRTSGGEVAVVLTTNRVAGTEYRIRATVPSLEGSPVAISPVIRVVPGLPANLQITSDGGRIRVPADDFSTLDFTVMGNDVHGNTLTSGTPVDWQWRGPDPQGTPDPEGSTGDFKSFESEIGLDGKARATVRSGPVAGPHQLQATVQGVTATFNVDVEPVLIQFLQIPAQMELCAEAVETVRIRATGAVSGQLLPDGAQVLWFAQKGAISPANPVSFIDFRVGTLQNGEATADLTTFPRYSNGARIPFGRESAGNCVVSASIGNNVQDVNVTFILPQPQSQTPVNLQADHPVIAGNRTTDGVLQIEQLDGTFRPVNVYATTPMRIHADPNHAIQVSVLRNNLPVARYPMDAISGASLPDATGAHLGTVSGAVADSSKFLQGSASLFFGGDDSATIPDRPALRIQDGLRIDAYVNLDVLGQDAWVLRKGADYEILVRTDNRLTFRVSTGSGLFEVTSSLVLDKDSWHAVSVAYQGGTLSLSVDTTTDTAAAAGFIMTSLNPVTLGENFRGNIDNLVVTDLNSAPLFVTSGLDLNNRITTDLSGNAIFFIHSTGLLAGTPQALHAEAEFLAIYANPGTGDDPCQREKVVVTDQGVIGHVGDVAAGFVWGGGSGADAISGDIAASVLIWGDIRDLAVNVGRLVPGGEASNWTVTGFAVFGLITEVPGLLEGPDAAIGAIKVILKRVRPSGALARKLVTFGKRLIKSLASPAELQKLLDDAKILRDLVDLNDPSFLTDLDKIVGDVSDNFDKLIAFGRRYGDEAPAKLNLLRSFIGTADEFVPSVAMRVLADAPIKWSDDALLALARAIPRVGNDPSVFTGIISHFSRVAANADEAAQLSEAFFKRVLKPITDADIPDINLIQVGGQTIAYEARVGLALKRMGRAATTNEANFAGHLMELRYAAENIIADPAIARIVGFNDFHRGIRTNARRLGMDIVAEETTGALRYVSVKNIVDPSNPRAVDRIKSSIRDDLQRYSTEILGGNNRFHVVLRSTGDAAADNALRSSVRQYVSSLGGTGGLYSGLVNTGRIDVQFVPWQRFMDGPNGLLTVP